MFGRGIPAPRWASDRESERSVVGSAYRLQTVVISAE
jgi:hypothetical protein